MRDRFQTIQKSERIGWFYILIVLLVTLHYLFLYPERYLIWSGYEPIFNALRMLHVLLIVLLLLLCLLKLRRGMPPEFWLLFAYFVWVLITRVVNHDYTLFGDLYFSAVCVGVFAAGIYLSPHQRRRLLDLFCAITGTYLFILSVLGLLVWFGGKDAFPHIAAYVSNRPFLKAKDIIFFNTTHNMSAAWFMVSFFLSAYEWAACEKRFWRIPIALHMSMMLIMISLLHCRSIQVASSVGVGMLAVLAVMPHIERKSLPLKISAILVTALLGMLICFEAINLCGEVFTKGLKITQSEWDTYYTEQAEKTKNLPEEQKADYPLETAANPSGADARDFLHDALTLTERTLIWDAAFRLMKSDSHIALFGQPEENMMDAVNALGNYREVKQHTHNIFVQAMVLTGIPGALMLLAFACLQVIRMVRAYFDKTGKVQREDKVLLILPAALLVYGMAEVLLNRLVGFASLSFLLAGGIFTEFEREAFRNEK